MNMYRLLKTIRYLCLAITTLILIPSFVQGISINEIRIDQPGADNDEYFELTGNPGDSLDAFSYIVIGDSGTNNGVVEEVVSLSGYFMPSEGFFLVAENTFSLSSDVDMFTSLNFENSDNVTHMLVSGFSGTNGDDLDTNDDGMLDITPWTLILDSVALIEDPLSGDKFYSPTTIGPDGSSVPYHVYRSPDETGLWQIGLSDPVNGDDTPKMSNPSGIIPEPASSLLFLSGVATMAALNYKKRKK
jgi:hypothetical protein